MAKINKAVIIKQVRRWNSLCMTFLKAGPGYVEQMREADEKSRFWAGKLLNY